ncbi:MAG: beta-ketoacyl-[acyl-carrier-protein] synthase family protein [Verrucomicrobiota bacterium]|nr:beta-ketoacyl-[acyl-carrier-protein] synthase family protein [Verrucomicrobiota bacterium]
MAAFVLKSGRAESRRRVAVTGVGVISPAGNDLETFWRNVTQGRSAAAPVTKFDVSKLPVKIAAEVKDFNIADYSKANYKRLDQTIQFGVAAATLAVRDSRLDIKSAEPSRIGIVEGTTISGSESILKSHDSFLESNDYRKLHPYNIVAGYCGEGSSTISMQLGIQGAAITYCSGCASGNDAIGHAMKLIQADQFDAVLAGGSEQMVEMLHIGFCRLGAMSEHNDDPPRAMRPFDRTRDGFVLGEGATFLVLEELAHALARGADIYAEVIGHGRTAEAYHPTNPHPEGVGYIQAMQRALRDAELHPEEVDYINAHGSATLLNDPVETKAVKAVFGDHARRLSISATKPVTGHLMGASGAIETAICALTVKHQAIPPTINFTSPEDGCDLDYVTNARSYPVQVALNLNAGFGGRYACLLLRKYPSS